jgi:hypothetical protein
MVLTGVSVQTAFGTSVNAFDAATAASAVAARQIAIPNAVGFWPINYLLANGLVVTTVGTAGVVTFFFTPAP